MKLWSAILSVLLCALAATAQQPAQQPVLPPVHFHHVHLNSVNPDAAIDFYTKHFNAEAGKFAGKDNAVWTQKSWLLFNKVSQPPPYEVLSPIYHIGWGAEDMKAEYERQLDMGTKFDTPITDASDLFGTGTPGRSFFAYVDGPDHVVIELNTTNNHVFQHIHLLSDDPVAAAAWYAKHLGATPGIAGPGRTERREVKGLPVFPMTSVRVDNVNIIWFPKEFASQGVYKKQWEGRTDFAKHRGRAVDHFAFSVDHLDPYLAALKADGVKILQAPRKTMHGAMRSAFIEGPDHMEIELVEGQAVKQ